MGSNSLTKFNRSANGLAARRRTASDSLTHFIFTDQGTPARDVALLLFVLVLAYVFVFRCALIEFLCLVELM